MLIRGLLAVAPGQLESKFAPGQLVSKLRERRLGHEQLIRVFQHTMLLSDCSSSFVVDEAYVHRCVVFVMLTFLNIY